MKAGGNEPGEISGITYKVILSRRRSVSIIVSPGKGVIVRAPYRTSLNAIQKFVREKSGWIKKHLQSNEGLERINHGKNYTDGESHLFRGKEYFLRIAASERPFVRLSGNNIEIFSGKNGGSESIKGLLQKWYKSEAQKLLSEKLNQVLIKYSEYSFHPSELVVKTLKTRWGSCSSRGKITLNSELVKLDEKFSEYVIIHELCHLRYHNHGQEYYSLLEEIVPDYKSVRKELRSYVTK